MVAHFGHPRHTRFGARHYHGYGNHDHPGNAIGPVCGDDCKKVILAIIGTIACLAVLCWIFGFVLDMLDKYQQRTLEARQRAQARNRQWPMRRNSPTTLPF